MKYHPIILLLILGCTDKVKLKCPPNYNNALIQEIENINCQMSQPTKTIRMEILQHIFTCPRLNRELLNIITYNQKLFNKSGNDQYYLNLGYNLDSLLDSRLEHK